jgi:ATP-dependent Lon protease
MQLPGSIAVMTLPEVTLFPHALLPLRIFEPRFRAMLRDALESHRLFAVAMQKPGRIRETPSVVAGLGLIRVAMANRDGTSNLVLQGLARIELLQTLSTRPYRVHRVRQLAPEDGDRMKMDALTAKVRELVGLRLQQRVEPHPLLAKKLAQLKQAVGGHVLTELSPEPMLKYLGQITDPGKVADLVSSAFLPAPRERQTILETIEIETRLRYLIQFLGAEIRRHTDTAADAEADTP